LNLFSATFKILRFGWPFQLSLIFSSLLCEISRYYNYGI
jgi:hypothetical protein